MKKLKTKDKTVLKALGLGGCYGGGGEGMVDIKDGKIVRMRPFHYDWKDKRGAIQSWRMTKNGKTLTPVLKGAPSAFSLAYKKRVYSPNRIPYPLKRVDWDPTGDRNPQNRGKSKFKRISWDEAATLVADEIKRVHKDYGPSAILMQGDGHGENAVLHAVHGQSANLLNLLGGFTLQVRNPDSWEGWYWGSKHVWGQGLWGMYFPNENVHKDVTDHAEMVLFWSGDPETTVMGAGVQSPTRLLRFWRDLGIRQIFITPDLNYSAAMHADKWIPIYPNTDAALQLAIAYMWIIEGTYDKEYVATHVVGFDRFMAYVLGEEDGIPKDPAWAAPKCGVAKWTIKALAREFARKRTSIAHYMGGGMIRGPFSHEPARLEACLLGMQGLGGPGVHQVTITFGGMPRYESANWQFWMEPGAPDRIRMPMLMNVGLWEGHLLPKTLVHKAIESDEPLVFHGTGSQEAPVEDQFKTYTHPLPKQEGGSEIRMMWTDCPCSTTCWNGGNERSLAFRNSKIECIVAQHPWMENDCLFADIILPVNTHLEVEDIITNAIPGIPVPNLMYCERAIDPVGESKSNFEAVLEVAKKLGMEEALKEGGSDEALMAATYESLGGGRILSFDDFKEKKYLLFPIAEDWEKDLPYFRRFYHDPEKFPLQTPSGKLEFYSERLAEHFPDDDERPPIPKWIERTDLHDERRSGDRADHYPLILITNHPRWRMHAQGDDIPWTREAPTCKITGPDGYQYEPIWINPIDAEKRHIKYGDIVKVFNERGVVLSGAYVTERIRPGVVSQDHGARLDFIKVGEVDRGGCINAITPEKLSSKNCVGMATNGFLVQVEALNPGEYERWREEHPEAFERDYAPGSGPRVSAWIDSEIE